MKKTSSEGHLLYFYSRICLLDKQMFLQYIRGQLVGRSGVTSKMNGKRLKKKNWFYGKCQTNKYD